MINFIKDYINEFFNVIKKAEIQKEKIIKICNLLLKLKKKNTVYIFGNGGSNAIAAHFAMDLTNNTDVKCLSLNDPAIITCYANDFKFQNWISRAILKYTTKNDILILVSSSGKSKNMIEAIKAARIKKIKKIIVFTGFNKKNYMNVNSDINFWIDSKNYNIIENSHQFYLLMIVDFLKKKKK